MKIKVTKEQIEKALGDKTAVYLNKREQKFYALSVIQSDEFKVFPDSLEIDGVEEILTEPLITPLPEGYCYETHGEWFKKNRDKKLSFSGWWPQGEDSVFIEELYHRFISRFIAEGGK